jgi:hypothetical protein
MDVDEGVDEQTAPQIGGIASDLAALIIEGACDGVVVEIGVDEAAEGPEDQDIVLRQKPAFAEIDAGLEVDGLEVAVEVVLVAPAVGRDALAVLAVEPNCPSPSPTPQG